LAYLFLPIPSASYNHYVIPAYLLLDNVLIPSHIPLIFLASIIITTIIIYSPLSRETNSVEDKIMEKLAGTMATLRKILNWSHHL
jgi:hypothetical protein